MGEGRPPQQCWPRQPARSTLQSPTWGRPHRGPPHPPLRGVLPPQPTPTAAGGALSRQARLAGDGGFAAAVGVELQLWCGRSAWLGGGAPHRLNSKPPTLLLRHCCGATAHGTATGLLRPCRGAAAALLRPCFDAAAAPARKSLGTTTTATALLWGSYYSPVGPLDSATVGSLSILALQTLPVALLRGY